MLVFMVLSSLLYGHAAPYLGRSVLLVRLFRGEFTKRVHLTYKLLPQDVYCQFHQSLQRSCRQVLPRMSESNTHTSTCVVPVDTACTASVFFRSRRWPLNGNLRLSRFCWVSVVVRIGLHPSGSFPQKGGGEGAWPHGWHFSRTAGLLSPPACALCFGTCLYLSGCTLTRFDVSLE